MKDKKEFWRAVKFTLFSASAGIPGSVSISKKSMPPLPSPSSLPANFIKNSVSLVKKFTI